MFLSLSLCMCMCLCVCARVNLVCNPSFRPRRKGFCFVLWQVNTTRGVYKGVGLCFVVLPIGFLFFPSVFVHVDHSKSQGPSMTVELRELGGKYYCPTILPHVINRFCSH
jgi:hypothetical protein